MLQVERPEIIVVVELVGAPLPRDPEHACSGKGAYVAISQMDPQAPPRRSLRPVARTAQRLPATVTRQSDCGVVELSAGQTTGQAIASLRLVSHGSRPCPLRLTLQTLTGSNTVVFT
jgi:hypothetical protein